MRANENFVLQEIADEFIIIPVGEETERVNGIVKLNETGAFLWKIISSKDMTVDDLVHAITAEYQVDEILAQRDVQIFLEKLKSIGCIG